MEPDVIMLRLGLTAIPATASVFDPFGRKLEDNDRLPLSGFSVHLTTFRDKEYAGTVTVDLSGNATAEFGKKHKIFKLKETHIFDACQWCWDKYTAQRDKAALR